ncbi:hypothetical protein CFIMG_005849RA [Ceratocystis fimbriata CBS 114723]|uniref:Uncharacterized protein n=2 Tax=Ceratocystis TaxID=5157 RepID=A0A2C5WYE4_9PEZI|nr:hypothetical protein CFIMG_005849RA [Ceratocystis fimbriata CBS 114723]
MHPRARESIPPQPVPPRENWSTVPSPHPGQGTSSSAQHPGYGQPGPSSAPAPSQQPPPSQAPSTQQPPVQQGSAPASSSTRQPPPPQARGKEAWGSKRMATGWSPVTGSWMGTTGDSPEPSGPPPPQIPGGGGAPSANSTPTSASQYRDERYPIAPVYSAASAGPPSAGPYSHHPGYAVPPPQPSRDPRDRDVLPPSRAYSQTPSVYERGIPGPPQQGPPAGAPYGERLPYDPRDPREQQMMSQQQQQQQMPRGYDQRGAPRGYNGP